MENGYRVNFNPDFTSVSVINKTGVRMHSITSMEKVEEIFAKEESNILIVDRLFVSSLVILVTAAKPNCLVMLHFKKNQDICHGLYPSPILNVRMNRNLLVVCLAEGFIIHSIRNMKVLHSITYVPPANLMGLCSLSWNSQLAYPISTDNSAGVLQIFNANKLTPGLTIKAHETGLSAMNFSPSGVLIATASERGTVIRVFCVKNGQRVQEFRRGVKRCVTIASLVFSANAEFICASSNTETVHIFKIDPKSVEATEKRPIIVDETTQIVGSSSSLEDLNTTNTTNSTSSSTTTTTTNTTSTATKVIDSEEKRKTLPIEITNENDANNTNQTNQSVSSSSWSGYLSKAVSSYLPSQVYEVLNQDRAFATAVLSQPGLKHACGLARIQNELKLLVACEDGFLYIYDLNETKGGICKLAHVHDMRSTLEGGVVELNYTEGMEKRTKPSQTGTATTRQQKKSNVIPVIRIPEVKPDNSYAGILKGDQAGNKLTVESAKYRNLCDAIDTPMKIFDDGQFPPVTATVAAATIVKN